MGPLQAISSMDQKTVPYVFSTNEGVWEIWTGSKSGSLGTTSAGEEWLFGDVGKLSMMYSYFGPVPVFPCS